ncbi:hypothetical protein [Tautonia marina]|uniref:hypothetical protein n=1 Tax=Tautonia marina TaxID=2653855 RepID=UPI001260B2DA|nr:hypothetical protein [Tautonia marina]
MKQKVKMLKTLAGVDEGKVYPETYREGQEYAVGEDLLRCFVDLGGVELVDAPTSTGKAHSRETKVGGPDETKPFDITKLNKKQIVQFAKDNFNLELNEEDKKDDLLAAIELAAEQSKSQSEEAPAE